MNVQRPTSNIQHRTSFARSAARGSRGSWVLRASLGILVLGFSCARGAAQQAAPIPATEITALEQELKQSVGPGISAVTSRRTCKSVIRKAEDLLKTSPMAANRFDLLKILFQGQQRLLSLEMTDQNRNALFETCEAFSKAPDEYAESRLEADLLISERDLSKAEALVAERLKALEDIMAKYRGTSAELRSLTIAALIAAKLQASDFQKEIHEKLKGRSFGADHKAIAFRRRSHAVSSLNVLFGGTYESVDGSSITFPFDRLGHQYLVIFWSQSSAGIEGYELFLSRIRKQQERFPDTFEVYSFNLDNLPDSGQSILTRAGVRATAIHLPEGRSSSVYNAYALPDPVAIFVNAQGHVTLRTGQVVPWPRSSPARGDIPANPGPGLGKWLDDVRYLAQLRSLFIGDFLVSGDECHVSGVDMGAIQECFVVPPFRYRLTQKEELANYLKAEKLCAAAIKKHSKVPDLWRIRNCRIVSLLGMWSLARESKHIDEAVEEARLVLAMNLPAGGDVVAQFCLAKHALRTGDTDTEGILKKIADPDGGETEPAVAYAAAAIVAIEANAETLYGEYRKRFLEMIDENDSSLWPVTSFMRDRHHDYRLFWANPGRWGYTRKQRYRVRQLIYGFRGPANPTRVLTASLKDLDGKELKLPEAAKGKMMGLIFVEPPSDESARASCVKWLKDYAGRFSKRDVPVVAAFLSEDVSTVRSIVQECGGSFRPALVPGGLSSPLVMRLGILRADSMPNPFLLLGDGTIVWSTSGLTYEVEHTGMEIYTATAIGANIEKVRTDRAFEALDRNDFKKALSLLGERLPPKMGTDPWTADRRQGRALAHMGLNDWTAALAEIDAAIAELMRASRHGGRVHRGSIEMRHVRATVLGKVGRAKEAAAEKAQAEKEEVWLKTAPYFYPPSYARMGVAVGVYVDLLKSVRLKLEGRDQ